MRKLLIFTIELPYNGVKIKVKSQLWVYLNNLGFLRSAGHVTDPPECFDDFSEKISGNSKLEKLFFLPPFGSNFSV